MAQFLDYIIKQVDNLDSTISDVEVLKKAGLYEITRYISEEPDFIWGGKLRHYNTQMDLVANKNGDDSGRGGDKDQMMVRATYGISYDFIKLVQKESLKQEPKKQVIWFRNCLISQSGYYNKDVRIGLEKLFRTPNFDEVAKAMCNVINYQVLNHNYRSFIEYYGYNGITKMTNNIPFSDLPYGKLSPIQAPFERDKIKFDDSTLLYLLKKLSPYNLNFTNSFVDDTMKIIRCVGNESEGYVSIKYPYADAKGFIKSNKISFDLTDRENNSISCVPLSVQTETDTAKLLMPSESKEYVFDNETKYELLSSKKYPNGCSQQELDKISQDLDFVKNLPSNPDFIKIEDVAGKQLLSNITAFAKISQNLNDNLTGNDAITLKVFFDKKNDVFASVRSTDLYLAVYCATYAYPDDVKVDFYYNSSKNLIYVVNKNTEQFGYCTEIGQGLMSNCEYVVYAQLLQTSLSELAKYNLMVDGNLMPLMLSDNVIRETAGLREAMNRQNYLLSLQESDLFFDLFVRNIGSYVYSYATQVRETRIVSTIDEKTGVESEQKVSRLVWETKPNPMWSEKYDPNTKTTPDKWLDDEGKYVNPNYFYIYDVRETFWKMNNTMKIKEVLAYFVSKGDNLPNSSYYRELCQRILGVDYMLFYKKLLPPLLDAGLLCIEDLEYQEGTKVLIKSKFSFAPEYASGDVYGKLAKLQGSLGENITLLYGQVKGDRYIANQTTLLNDAKPERVTFGNQIPELNLTLNAHNPIFYQNKVSFIGTAGDLSNTLRNGKVAISTDETDVNNYERYKRIDIVDNFDQQYRDNWLKGLGGPNVWNHHLAKFEEWIRWGEGAGMISKDYIEPEMIRDAYIYPKGKELFVPLWVMPKFSDRVGAGKTVKSLPLGFESGYGEGRFTSTSIYNESRYGAEIGNSYLSQLSREHLIKAGLVSKKPKIKAKGKTYTPITKEEGKTIYNVLLSRYNKLESEIKIEGDRLFTAFCQKVMTPEYSKEIETLWNATYNNLAIPDYSKFPIFCEHGRWFRSIKSPVLFSLREAQLEGMKFSVSNQNSGLLAHEVGFGKTTTSIALISHMNLTGESSRNIVFTPNQVYEKFYDEITGNRATGKFGLLGNWENPYNVVKMGNALQGVLLGPIDKSGRPPVDERGVLVKTDALKTYEPGEYAIIHKFKSVLDEVKNTIGGVKKGKRGYVPGTGLPMRQLRFFTQQDVFPQISDDIADSDAFTWWSTLKQDLYSDSIDELNNYPKTKEIINQVDIIMERYYDIIESELQRMRTGGREGKAGLWQPFEFKKGLLSQRPKYVQKWYRKARAKYQPLKINIPVTEYPSKLWVKDIDGAVELGVITPGRASKLKALPDEWEGTLTPLGYQKMYSIDDGFSKLLFNRDSRQGALTKLITSMRGQLIDVLGKYKGYVMQRNTIVLCSYDIAGGAIKRFRVSRKAREKAKQYIGNVDHRYWVPYKVDRAFEDLALNPLSLMSLNITGVVVDEIHNFNNLVGNPRTHTLANVPIMRGKEARKLHLLPTQQTNARLSVLPDGETVKPNKGIYTDSERSYAIGYNTSGKGSMKGGPTSLMSIIFEIQENPLNRARNVSNSVVMSATPFTDNVFQMFSVLGMTNRQKLKDSNLDKVFEFFITFVKEEWRFNITHKNEFGLFAEIQGYYNTFAMANFIKAMANFKVSDAQIEKNRPQKYLIPQEQMPEGGGQAGVNTSSRNYSKHLKKVSSYIELSPTQRTMMEKIAGFVAGEYDSPYVVCPNYAKFQETSQEDGSFLDNEEYQEMWNSVKELMKEAQKDESKRKELLEDALEIVGELRDENKGVKAIQNKYDQIDDLLYSTSKTKEEQEEILSEILLDADNIGVLALDEEQVWGARAIRGQGTGQRLVISPYLVSCDKEGVLENELLPPLDPNNMSVSAKNFIEESPKLKYAIECALNSIKYDAQNPVNDYQVGGQVIYLNAGKSFMYGGHTYNAYKLIKQYIIDKKFSYTNKATGKKEQIGDWEIEIITGGMSKSMKMEDADNPKTIAYDYSKNKEKEQGAREEIRDRFLRGSVKILLGSSAIKEGIDLHERAHTLYITDSDFSPSNAMQLEGRIWRQGNMWENVRIVYVLGRDSIDAFVYSKLQQKIGEIKKMLEAGVYEMNKTQFTINAKERIKKIITDVEKLAELEWQDEQDDVKNEIARITQEQNKLEVIKNHYQKYKIELGEYVESMNKLYALLVNEEKIEKAKDIIAQLDIKREREYSLNMKGKDAKFILENPFVPLTILDGVKIVDEKIADNTITLDSPDITLTADTKMPAINDVVEKIRRAILNNRQTISRFMFMKDFDRRAELSKIPKDDWDIGYRLVEGLIDIKDFQAMEQVIQYVSKFGKGQAKEGVMSDYSYLIANRPKKKNGVEVLNNGKKVMCDYFDIDQLMYLNTESLNDLKVRYNDESGFKKMITKKIILEQENAKKRVGATLNQLIEKFKNSEPLITLRQ